MAIFPRGRGRLALRRLCRRGVGSGGCGRHFQAGHGFTFAGGQRVTLPGCGTTFAQTGGAVTATNLSWNGALAPNASTGIGFTGTYSGANPAPDSFTLNGSTCTAA